MNVIIANEQQNTLSNLDIDIIKNISGVYDVSEIVEMFRSFFYSKMILDVTSLKNYGDIRTYEVLVKGLEAEKIIFLLPEGSNLCTPNFLGHLISLGIYNFTTNSNGIKYLLKKPNTLKDVESILKMKKGEQTEDTGTALANVSTRIEKGQTIIGFKNASEHAGATTFIYILKKELASIYGKEGVLAIEIDKSDFQLFRDKQMITVKETDIKSAIAKFSNVKIILVDLNKCRDDSFCSDVIYLLEPSTIKLNRLVANNKLIFNKISKYKVILNMSLLLNNDVMDFESEAGMKVFYNMPPLDERKKNAIVVDFLSKLGLYSNQQKGNSNRIFGLFRR